MALKGTTKSWNPNVLLVLKESLFNSCFFFFFFPCCNMAWAKISIGQKWAKNKDEIIISACLLKPVLFVWLVLQPKKKTAKTTRVKQTGLCSSLCIVSQMCGCYRWSSFWCRYKKENEYNHQNLRQALIRTKCRGWVSYHFNVINLFE